MQIPLRSSLVAQVVEILRRGIRSGEWRQRLPSEREFCSRLHISRPTIRAALTVLQRGGWVEVTRGQRRRICARAGRPRPKRDVAPRAMGVLFMAGREETTPLSVLLFKELEGHFHAAGYETSVHIDARFNKPHPEKLLRNLVRANKVACWLLMASSLEVQRWFMTQGIPAFVAGSRHAGIQLPSFDLNHQAICRHAAQVLWRLGHRRIVLVSPRSELAGDLNSERGFREAFQRPGRVEGCPLVVHHDGTVDDIRRVLTAQFRACAPPTAIVVVRSTDTLTVISHLIISGIHVPRDVSIISRDDDEFLSHVTPAVARYRMDWSIFLRRLSRSVLLLARAGTLEARETLITPQFFKGETVTPRNPTETGAKCSP